MTEREFWRRWGAFCGWVTQKADEADNIGCSKAIIDDIFKLVSECIKYEQNNNKNIE